jgi:tetratricopeptide (TPR) repeat protein
MMCSCPYKKIWIALGCILCAFALAGAAKTFFPRSAFTCALKNSGLFASSSIKEIPDEKRMALLRGADALRVEGRSAEAVSAYEKIIQTYPDFAEAYFRLGALYFSLGIPSKSEEYYLMAIKKGFKNPEIYFHLGYIKESQSKLQEALEWYLQAEEKGVGSAEIFYNIGNVFAQLGNFDRAIEYYKKVVAINPRHMDAFTNLSIVSFQKSNYPDAIFYLDKAKDLGYKPPREYEQNLKIKALSK